MSDKEKGINENGRKNESRSSSIGICVFVCLDVLLLALIITTVYYVSTEGQLDLLHESDLCVACKELRIHPDDTIQGLIQKGKNNEICCMKVKENSDVLVGNFVDHWLKERLEKDDRPFMRYQCENDGITDARKPTIKLVGRTTKQTGEHHKVLWDGRSGAAILPTTKDITHHEEHGFIEIKKAGMYQIYTQLVFNHDMLWHKKHHKPSIYQQMVIRIQSGRSEEQAKIILKSSNTHCKCKGDDQIVSSYLGGAFQLLEGDRLAVTVRNKTEVVPVAHLNFFGVHML